MGILFGIVMFGGGVFSAPGVQGGVAWFRRRAAQARNLAGDVRDEVRRIRDSN